MIITISGRTGSGKSTVGRTIARRLGYRFVSIGDIRALMAKDRGVTLDQLNSIGMDDDRTDTEPDRHIIEMRKEDNLVIDGRTAFHFIPDSLKVYLDIDPKVAAERIFKDIRSGLRNDEGPVDSPKDVLDMIISRDKQNRARYLKHYSIDINDQKNYDLVIDTTGLNIEQIASKILEGY